MALTVIQTITATRALSAIDRWYVSSSAYRTGDASPDFFVVLKPFGSAFSAICSIRVFIMTVFRSNAKLSSWLYFKTFGALLGNFIGKSLNVNRCMLGLRFKQFKIARRIVEFISVFVVDNFFSRKWSSKYLFHYPPMFKISFPVFTNIPITEWANVSASVWCSHFLNNRTREGG